MKIVPVQIQKMVSSPKARTFVENTIFAVSAETGLKMIGRPAFIMADKEADSAAKKKYAAVKEMLYQGTCLGLYLSCVQPLKKVFYNGISKVLSKTPENAVKLDSFNKSMTELKELKSSKVANNLIDALEQKIKTDKNMHLGKGARELSAIAASITMLTLVAPQISHVVIHPVMKALGMEKK